jgi:hypothetical protein
MHWAEELSIGALVLAAVVVCWLRTVDFDRLSFRSVAAYGLASAFLAVSYIYPDNSAATFVSGILQSLQEMRPTLLLPIYLGLFFVANLPRRRRGLFGRHNQNPQGFSPVSTELIPDNQLSNGCPTGNVTAFADDDDGQHLHVRGQIPVFVQPRQSKVASSRSSQRPQQFMRMEDSVVMENEFSGAIDPAYYVIGCSSRGSTLCPPCAAAKTQRLGTGEKKRRLRSENDHGNPPPPRLWWPESPTKNDPPFNLCL